MSVYYSVGPELYEAVYKMKPWTTLYGKNYFLTSGPIMLERKKEAILSVQRAKEEITKLAEEIGYSVEFFTRTYPDKIVFRRVDNFVKKEGLPDYFRIDSHSGEIID